MLPWLTAATSGFPQLGFLLMPTAFRAANSCLTSPATPATLCVPGTQLPQSQVLLVTLASLRSVRLSDRKPLPIGVVIGPWIESDFTAIHEANKIVMMKIPPKVLIQPSKLNAHTPK
jgi:hypothetical protein